MDEQLRFLLTIAERLGDAGISYMMNHTSPEVQAEFRRRLRATDASERLQMMSGMFAAAKALARAAMRGPGDDADPPQVVLFRRMYRTDFSAREMTAISEHLKTTHAGDPVRQLQIRLLAPRRG